jgi:hypothetical protein
MLVAGLGAQAVTTSAPAVAVTRGWIDTSNRNAVLTAYHNTFDPAEPAANWTGNIAACNPGTLAAAHRAYTLNRINWYRGMAGVLDGVVEDATFTTKAQQAALMMAANNALSHTPPASWNCYTADGAFAASKSNLYLGLSGAPTVDGFIQDSGSNNLAVGHRNWLLDRTEEKMGIASVPSAPQSAAHYVIDDNSVIFPATLPATREATGFVSWPPRGFVPNPKIYPRWSVQREGADFTNAAVSVTVGGSPVANSIIYAGNTGVNSKPMSSLVFTPTLPAFPANADLVIAVTITGIGGSGIPTSYSWTTTAIPPSAPTPTTHTVADFNANGTTDISVYRPAAGQWYVQGQSPVSFGSTGDVPVTADYDGNGSADIAVFRPSSGGWFRNGAATTFFGVNGDIPVPADYDGDGSADIAVFRPSVGGWYRNGAATTFFGLNGDIPVPGDYDGNGTTDIAVYRPSVGGWYVQGQAPVFLGLNGDIPVPGDYDGNGTTDKAVFRPSSGQWFVQGQAAVPFGINGDRPLPLPSAIRGFFFP